jgi:hypothetical protein
MATKTKLWKIGTAHAEGSEYEGEYRSTLVRFIRVTDFNYWPGRNPMHEKDATQTVWHGYVAGDIERVSQGVTTFRWDIVAESCGTRREAMEELERYIDRMIG